jgi:hypothetical protein
MIAAATAFTDAPYRRSHGRSAQGRGSWGFQETASDTASERDLRGEIIWTPTMTFTEAKRWMRRNHPGTLWALLP